MGRRKWSKFALITPYPVVSAFHPEEAGTTFSSSHSQVAHSLPLEKKKAERGARKMYKVGGGGVLRLCAHFSLYFSINQGKPVRPPCLWEPATFTQSHSSCVCCLFRGPVSLLCSATTNTLSVSSTASQYLKPWQVYNSLLVCPMLTPEFGEKWRGRREESWRAKRRTLKVTAKVTAFTTP